MLAWTGLLNWICGLKYGTTISWFIVFLPLILFLILFIIVYHMMETNKLSNKDLQRLVKENKENKEDDIEGLANSCKD